MNPLLENTQCKCKNSVNWNKIIAKVVVKMFFSALIKIVVTKLIVDGLKNQNV